MIEVLLTLRDGMQVDSAEADDAEAALFAAQTLYDEADHGRYGLNYRTLFLVNGRVVARVDGYPSTSSILR